MTIDRTKLIEAAERTYRQQQAREVKFRAFMCSHLGLAPGTACDQAEAIIACNDPKVLTKEQLRLIVHFDAGLPPGYSLSSAQYNVAAKAILARTV